jgi:hypothetical protein
MQLQQFSKQHTTCSYKVLLRTAEKTMTGTDYDLIQGSSQDYIYASQKACRYNDDTPSLEDFFFNLYFYFL